jgi:anti-anti-sigma regulatory factor
MPSPPDPTPAGAPLALPSHGSTVIAEDFRVQLVMAIDEDGPVRIDASGVESVGQAVLQLLLAAREEADRREQPFEIVAPSPAFARRAVACGLAEALGIQDQEVLFQ